LFTALRRLSPVDLDADALTRRLDAAGVLLSEDSDDESPGWLVKRDWLETLTPPERNSA